VKNKFPVIFSDSATLDAGRVLAATVIFYFHIGLVGRYPLSFYAEYAVEYFVILSGITYVLFTRIKPSTLAEYFTYLKKRLAALLPAYVLVNVAFYGASFLYPSALGRPYGFWEFLASATGVSMYFGLKFMSTVMWFMPFILQVYLLLPLLEWCLRRVHPAVLMLAAFGVSYLATKAVPLFLADWDAINLVCKNWSPIFRLPEVCVGIVAGKLVENTCGFWKGVCAIVVFALLSLSTSLLNASGCLEHFYMPWSGFLIPVLIFGATGLAWPMLRGFNVKTMRLLGLSSFAFYLIQAAPLGLVSRRLGDHLAVWIGYYLACWALAVVLTLAVARMRNIFEVRPSTA
jgi:peptidoglycan/LPS O-acetylase OafA/YrhL